MRHERVEIDGPALPRLAHCLRNPDTWPRDFAWNFCYGNTCAIGLARRLWPGADISEDRLGEAFGISQRAAYAIFVETAFVEGLDNLDDVTPAAVAGLIDTYLAFGGLPLIMGIEFSKS